MAAALVFALVSRNGAAGDEGASSPQVVAPLASRPASAPATATPAPAAAQQGVTPRPTAYECRWASGPVAVDGKPEDEAWKHAQIADHFYLPWLGKDAHPAKAATRARLLWDREYLYFLADMDDADLFADVTEHDGPIWNNDAFELFLKPAVDKPGYYEFEVSPANAVLDMFLPSRERDGYERFKSDGHFDVKTAVQLRGTLNRRDDRDAGWTVEGRIAWKSLLRTGGRPEPGEQWHFALCRVDDTAGADKQELSTTAPLSGAPRADFHRHEEYAPLTFVGEGASPRPASARAPGIDALPPLTTSRVVGSPEPPPPYRVVNAYPRLTLPHPIAIAPQPGSDRMLLVVHDTEWGPTNIVRIVDDPQTDRFETLLELDSIAYDFAFHPDFSRNGHVYVGLNGPVEAKEAKRTRVVRYHIDPKPPYALDAASATMIIEWESDGHNGGALDFGPDGMLYVTSGDGTSDSDRWNSGQDLSRVLGKVLRIDVDRPDAGRAYSVPKDNPFVGEPGARPETWCYGLRNPWRMKFDPANGQLWVTQNGQDQYEQVYLAQRGANYGWSASEGSHPFYPDRHRGRPISPPAAEHPHAEARSLTGGVVYHGSSLPDVRGAYIYGDHSTGKIWGIRHDGKQVVWNRELADTTLKITGFGANRRGELLVLDHVKNGTICRLEPTPPAEASEGNKFPRTLSESGLFKSVQSHAMQDGILPYSVNAELWSDGAHKERFIAIPAKAGEDRRIGFAAKGGFEFPDETVLVKSFALKTDAGRPETQRWIETRFLTKQQGEWVGYTYAWNAQGTDATLVEAAGRDQPFEIKDPSAPGGVRLQTWHYPSRAECMVCHSRVANFVLGPSLLQFNKDHDYGGGRVDNQLRVLEHVGLLKSNWHGDALNNVRTDGKRKDLDGDALDAYVQKETEAKGQREARPSRLLTKGPAAYEKLVDPYDEKADLNGRARSYLHANCAICHVEAGGGNAMMELDFPTPPENMRLFDAVPLHDALGLADARLIAPGAPERSILPHRMSIRGPGQMPPLATSLVDDRAVALMRRWAKETKVPVAKPEAAKVGAAGP